MPPAETTTWRPARSSVRRRRGRAPRGRASKISAGSGSRPLPVSLPVSRPSAGSMTSAPRCAQGGDVGLGGGVLPHLGVHRGREHDRAAGGQQGVGEQVVGQPVRGLGQQVGGRRGDHHQVGAPARSARAAPRGRRSTRRSATGLPDSAAQVGAPTNSSAAAVGTTVTSWPDSVKRRSSSQALYAAMPPETPRTTRGRSPSRGTARRVAGHARHGQSEVTRWR